MPVLPPVLTTRFKMRKASSSAFSPSDISGLQLWLDATTGLFDATSGGSAVTTDGSAVARWEDQSGNGNHFTQSTSNNRPVLKTSVQNSKNIVRFDGSNDFLDAGDVLDFGDDSVFCAMIIKASNTSNEVGVFNKTRAAQNVGRWAFTLNQNSGLKYSSSIEEPTGGSLKQIFTTTSVGTSFVLISNNFIRNSGTNAAKLRLRYNKSEQATSADYTRSSSPLNTTNNLYVGVYGNSDGNAPLANTYFNGDVGEIVFYKTTSPISSSDIDKIEDYLFAKWGL